MRRPTPKLGWFRSLSRYYRDPSASILGKLVAFVALIYAIVPFDLIPDVPIVGWVDDLGVMGLATAWLLRAVARYRTPEALGTPGARGGDSDPRADLRKPFSVSP
jgi:uncharacterized membrane protein YkvA (DUF1232 family)